MSAQTDGMSSDQLPTKCCDDASRDALSAVKRECDGVQAVAARPDVCVMPVQPQSIANPNYLQQLYAHQQLMLQQLAGPPKIIANGDPGGKPKKLPIRSRPGDSRMRMVNHKPRPQAIAAKPPAKPVNSSPVNNSASNTKMQPVPISPSGPIIMGTIITSPGNPTNIQPKTNLMKTSQGQLIASPTSIQMNQPFFTSQGQLISPQFFAMPTLRPQFIVSQAPAIMTSQGPVYIQTQSQGHAKLLTASNMKPLLPASMQPGSSQSRPDSSDNKTPVKASDPPVEVKLEPPAEVSSEVVSSSAKLGRENGKENEVVTMNGDDEAKVSCKAPKEDVRDQEKKRKMRISLERLKKSLVIDTGPLKSPARKTRHAVRLKRPEHSSSPETEPEPPEPHASAEDGTQKRPPPSPLSDSQGSPSDAPPSKRPVGRPRVYPRDPVTGMPIKLEAKSERADCSPMDANCERALRINDERRARASQRQLAVVKPQVLTHVIEGYVIHEAPSPFPTSEKRTPPSPPPDDFERVCGFCGRVVTGDDKRFCSVTCARKNNIHYALKTRHIRKRGNAQQTLAKLRKQLWRKRKRHRPTHEARLRTKPEPSLTPPVVAQEMPTPPVQPKQETISPVKVEQPSSSPSRWTVEEVYEFVRQTPGCLDYANAFRTHEIDGAALLLLKEDHLMATMNMKLGPALKLCAKISQLKKMP